MLVSGIFMLLCTMAIITALNTIGGEGANVNTGANKAAAAMIFVFFMIYDTFVEGSTYTYVSELFPSHLRARDVTFAVSNLYFINAIFAT